MHAAVFVKWCNSMVNSCIADIQQWMTKNHLKLNDDKIELIAFGSKFDTDQLPSFVVNVGTQDIEPTSVVRNLGANFDSKMTMESHVSAICQSAYFQFRNIGRVRKYITVDATKTLIRALVVSKMDYCNSLLLGITCKQLRRLQLIQNTAARIITRTRPRDHITPILCELHWLPVPNRIDFKVLCVTFKCLHGSAPLYLEELLQLVSHERDLRSNGQLLLQVPRTKTVTADRAFSIAAPKLWNALPSSIRAASSLEAFKRMLKTHIFNVVYHELV